MAELKPCPFCGGTDIEVNRIYDEADEVDKFYLSCNGCGIEQSICIYKTTQEAIKAWNTRAKESERE